MRAVGEGEAERAAGGEVADDVRATVRRLHEREGVRCIPHAQARRATGTEEADVAEGDSVGVPVA